MGVRSKFYGKHKYLPADFNIYVLLLYAMHICVSSHSHISVRKVETTYQIKSNY